MTVFFEIGATVLGLVQGALVMLNKRINWLFYSLQMLFLVIFALLNNLYGDVLSSSAYIVVGIVGFIMWGSDGNRRVTNASVKEKTVYSLLIALCTAVVAVFLYKTSDPLPLLDAFTPVSGIFATYYMLCHKLDAWILWFINDVFYIIEYYMLPDRAWYLLLLNVIWTVMAVASYIEWKRIMKREEEESASQFVIE